MQKTQTSPGESKSTFAKEAQLCNVRGLNGCIFTDLEDGEQLLLVVRKHWIVTVQTLFLLLVLAGISVGLFFIGNFAGIPPVFTLTSIVGLCMFGILYTFVQWVNNELDILLLTDRRIISYDQIKFLDRKVAQASIDQVQEVNASTAGFLGNILHYGKLMIMTAGEASDFQLTYIPEALENSRLIHNYIDTYRHDLDKNVPVGVK